VKKIHTGFAGKVKSTYFTDRPPVIHPNIERKAF